MRRGVARHEEEDAELNMTPMLDVVFILLIFFIVTAVFVKEPGVPVNRPEVQIINRDIKPAIIIAVEEDDDIWINKRLVDVREVKPEVEALRAENPKGDAIVQGDEKAKFSVVYEVMQTLQDAGIPAQYVSALPES
ncbi:MAG: biopolymer transporter ExbD [Caulobacterales bacterium]|nr:biopolymer transporter ExbD [Caulobacterales bacterium]